MRPVTAPSWRSPPRRLNNLASAWSARRLRGDARSLLPRRQLCKPLTSSLRCAAFPEFPAEK